MARIKGLLLLFLRQQLAVRSLTCGSTTPGSQHCQGAQPSLLSVAAAAGLYVLRKKNLVPDEAMLLLWGLPGLDFVVGGARRARALAAAAELRRAFPAPQPGPAEPSSPPSPSAPPSLRVVGALLIGLSLSCAGCAGMERRGAARSAWGEAQVAQADAAAALQTLNVTHIRQLLALHHAGTPGIAEAMDAWKKKRDPVLALSREALALADAALTELRLRTGAEAQEEVARRASAKARELTDGVAGLRLFSVQQFQQLKEVAHVR